MNRFRGNGPYGKIPTEKESITTLGFTLPYNNNLLLTEREGRTGEYWPEVVTVRTERRAVRTETTEGQYFPIRLEQARLVSSLLYGTGHGSCYIFFFQMHFRSIKFKGLPARDDTSNSERTSKLPRLCKKKLFTSSERFTSVTYGFSHFGGDNIQFFQVQLDWSRRNLSLPIEHLFWIRFRRSAKLSGFHLFCVNLLVHDLRFAL